MSATYQYSVAMTCGACSAAVNRVLTKMEGVETIDIDMEKQTVLVSADPGLGATYDAVLEKIKKTGKTVHGGEVVSG
ncbi:copper chaperone taha [Protomyces lactucae-debilis]|uniref:Copper chaperone taha n=1 Tax=Protomyces lactucae-debilis TaxID=2754530 RepID=A0A1Y2FED3_PROLT|nr:copper chaperone taha [Protomyces lactucae-debilis]ORY81967.1 copper chaperone taha [Protomyces lactucae-debilis]